MIKKEKKSEISDHLSRVKFRMTLSALCLIAMLGMFFKIFTSKQYNVEIKPFYPQNMISTENIYAKNPLVKEIIGTAKIYTNYYINKDGTITGNDGRILSESQGLILEYSIYIEDKELFDKSYKLLKEKMLLENNLFSWDYNELENKKSTASATIDDLRIFRNLVYANTLWGGYEDDIKKLEKGIRILYKKGYLVDHTADNKTGDEVSLFYVDAVALEMLESMSPYYKGISKKYSKLIEKNKVTKELPFYYKTYKVTDKDKENMKLNTLEMLLIIYNKKLMGESIDVEVAELKSVFQRDNGLFSDYLVGTALYKIESTAIYAYFKMISELQGDVELSSAIDKKIEMLTDSRGVPVSQEGQENGIIYSFDLLTLLIAQNRRK